MKANALWFLEAWASSWNTIASGSYKRWLNTTLVAFVYIYFFDFMVNVFEAKCDVTCQLGHLHVALLHIWKNWRVNKESRKRHWSSPRGVFNQWFSIIKRVICIIAHEDVILLIEIDSAQSPVRGSMFHLISLLPWLFLNLKMCINFELSNFFIHKFPGSKLSY